VGRSPAKQQYVGLDVHKNTIQVAVMDQDGKVLRNTKIGNTDEEVREAFARIPGSAKCVMESSSVWYGLFRFVSDELYEVTCPVLTGMSLQPCVRFYA